VTEAQIDALIASGLTSAQAHAMLRLDADVHCQRAFDREIARQDLLRSGFSREETEVAIDRALGSRQRTRLSAKAQTS
jgi:hypothetical protein